MTTTSNIGLKKIDGTDDWRDLTDYHNDSMEILDNSVAKNESSIAIVSDGNTHPAIAAGQFVYVRNHGTLTEGLYTANSAISANATLSSSNVTAVPGGGLNAIKNNLGSPSSASAVTGDDAFSKINALNSKLTWITGNSTTDKTASISVPNTANEVVVKVQIRDQISINYHLCKQEISSATQLYFDGGGVFASNGYGCRLGVKNYVFSIDTIYIGAGTEVFKMELFYR